jgi:hypothetical protein
LSSGASVNGEPADIDTTVAHAARVYDWLSGGVDNFEVDRQAAIHASADMPGGLHGAKANVRANRDFLGRAVRWLAGEAGVRQFLDIGTGIPSTDTVHGIAQQVAPASRVVYVDYDPIVLAHAHTLLNSTTEGATAFVNGDLRDPQNILLRAEATLDLGQPLAVVLVAVLHFIEDEDNPYGIVEQLMDATAPGSYLTISHGAADVDADNMALLAKRLSERSLETFVWRTREQVTRFFAGLELIDPGVVPVDHWHPDPASPPCDQLVPFYGAIARKPQPRDITQR